MQFLEMRSEMLISIFDVLDVRTMTYGWKKTGWTVGKNEKGRMQGVEKNQGLVWKKNPGPARAKIIKSKFRNYTKKNPKWPHLPHRN